MNSTFVDKDSLPAPNQGCNEGYESSASQHLDQLSRLRGSDQYLNV